MNDDLSHIDTEALEKELARRKLISEKASLVNTQSEKWDVFKRNLLEEINKDNSSTLSLVAELVYRFYMRQHILKYSAEELYNAECEMCYEEVRPDLKSILKMNDELIIQLCSDSKTSLSKEDLLEYYFISIRPLFDTSLYL